MEILNKNNNKIENQQNQQENSLPELLLCCLMKFSLGSHVRMLPLIGM